MPKMNPALAGVDLPARIAALPVGPNGFPVPWFVAWVGGVPEFRAMDHRKFVLAIRERRCWVCGEPMTRHLTFVAGPMCGINRTSSEPPSHTECARFSARYCPFLARPNMVRREGGLDELGATSAGFMIRRNPGAVMLWTTRQYRTFDDGRGEVLIRLGDPEAVEWYREGRPATRAEVEESVRAGLPSLEDLARGDGGDALAVLGRMVADFERYYPAGGGPS